MDFINNNKNNYYLKNILFKIFNLNFLKKDFLIYKNIFIRLANI